jgi:hypothetical protein
MSAYINHGKTSVKIATDRKRSSYSEKDCYEKYITTAAQVTAELNIHPEDPVSTKTVQFEPHKSNIHSRDATATPLITESTAQMHK